MDSADNVYRHNFNLPSLGNFNLPSLGNFNLPSHFGISIYRNIVTLWRFQFTITLLGFQFTVTLLEFNLPSHLEISIYHHTWGFNLPSLCDFNLPAHFRLSVSSAPSEFQFTGTLEFQFTVTLLEISIYRNILRFQFTVTLQLTFWIVIYHHTSEISSYSI